MATTFGCLLVCHSHGLGEVTTFPAQSAEDHGDGLKGRSPQRIPPEQTGRDEFVALHSFSLSLVVYGYRTLAQAVVPVSHVQGEVSWKAGP